MMKNSFDFIIESVGIYPNETIIIEACNILFSKMDNLKELIKSDEVEKLYQAIIPSIPNVFPISNYASAVIVLLENHKGPWRLMLFVLWFYWTFIPLLNCIGLEAWTESLL